MEVCILFYALLYKLLKGIVHLNIIFSYIKVIKICNLDHCILKIIYAGFLLHVYQNILYSVLSLTWVTPS